MCANLGVMVTVTLNIAKAFLLVFQVLVVPSQIPLVAVSNEA